MSLTDSEEMYLVYCTQIWNFFQKNYKAPDFFDNLKNFAYLRLLFPIETISFGNFRLYYYGI